MRYDYGASEGRRRATSSSDDLRTEPGSPDGGHGTGRGIHAVLAAIARGGGATSIAGPTGGTRTSSPGYLPAVVPTSVGSVVPMDARDEALACAVTQLTPCQGREGIPLPETVDTWPPFVFDEVEIPIEPSEIPGMVESLAREGYGPEQVAYPLHAIAADDPLTSEVFPVADEEMRLRLTVASMVAMALGRTGSTPADGT